MPKHSPLPWSVETLDNECEDGHVTTWCIVDANGKTIFDALNAEDAEVHLEGGDDPNDYGPTRVDLLSKANAEAIVAAMNATQRT